MFKHSIFSSCDIYAIVSLFQEVSECPEISNWRNEFKIQIEDFNTTFGS